MFRCLIVDNQSSDSSARLADLDESALPENDLLIDVEYAGLNYKDALAVLGKGNILSADPMIPGSDLAGTVRESRVEEFEAGDRVVVAGGGVGESMPGGLAQCASVGVDFAIRLPESFGFRDAMAFGTAGFSAVMAVNTLIELGIKADGLPIAVSRPTGGLGTVAIGALSRMGFNVTAVVDLGADADYALSLGANETVDASLLQEKPKSLMSRQWAGAIDNAGGNVLAHLIASTDSCGVVVPCGILDSSELTTSLLPFILRGTRLVGINPIYADRETRTKIWNQAAELFAPNYWQEISDEATLSDIVQVSTGVVSGDIRGRIVVDVNKY